MITLPADTLFFTVLDDMTSLLRTCVTTEPIEVYDPDAGAEPEKMTRLFGKYYIPIIETNGRNFFICAYEGNGHRIRMYVPLKISRANVATTYTEAEKFKLGPP